MACALSFASSVAPISMARRCRAGSAQAARISDYTGFMYLGKMIEFGPTDEIGVFEMSDRGLREVANPSELFLGERNEKAPGAAVFAGMEGTRPVLVEVQALALSLESLDSLHRL